MAFHNVIFICTIAIFLLILSSVQCRRESRQQQLRPTRGFKDLDLAVARGFGKRAVNMHTINDILMEWLAMEAKMRHLRSPKRLSEEDDLFPE